MYVIDGIAYAGEPSPLIEVISVQPLEDYRLLTEFSNSERKIFDFKPLLDLPVFRPLKNKELFAKVYVEYGTAVWNDSIDIAPETLYEKGSAVSDFKTA